MSTNVVLTSIDGEENTFSLRIRYESKVLNSHLPLVRMAFCVPLLNYGLFSHKFDIGFPLSTSDLRLLNDLNAVFSRDIFVNKVLKRRANYILPKFLPNEEKTRPGDATPKATIEPVRVTKDMPLGQELRSNSCGILSSGGKESLLTYGLMEEIGAEVHPLYVNESGGHWRTAIPAYRYHQTTDQYTMRVWTNIDRFYNFMLDHLHFIRSDHRNTRADTYPLRLCIFPFYVFALLPIFVDWKIGNLLIGSEFDDLKVRPIYRGIVHYFGVYDQHQDFDVRMKEWYDTRVPGLNQWSAVRSISGLVVERILMKRYPHLARVQRSCHSCHLEAGEVIPCGKCSKCLGILLFLLANKADPKIINYQEKAIKSFTTNVASSGLRLDQDEKDQSFYLFYDGASNQGVRPVDHVEKIHVNETTCNPTMIPLQFRESLMTIIEQYAKGYCTLDRGVWKPIESST